jgi:hypothetical protein
MSIRFPAERYPAFETALRQASNDTLRAVVVSEEEELVAISVKR